MASGQFAVRIAGDSAIVEITGEIDVSNVEYFTDSIIKASHAAKRTIIVSFEKVTYVDSCTINALIKTKDLAPPGKRLVIAVPNRTQIERIFKLVSIDRAIDVYESVEEASTAS